MAVFIQDFSKDYIIFFHGSDPTVLDDSSTGMKRGNRWFNTGSNEEFVCLDPFIAAAVWEDTTLSGGGVGGGPTGPAGGDLGGSYPNPIVLAFHSGGTQLLYQFLGDGQVLQRQGNNITSVSTASFSPATPLNSIQFRFSFRRDGFGFN